MTKPKTYSGLATERLWQHLKTRVNKRFVLDTKAPAALEIADDNTIKLHVFTRGQQQTEDLTESAAENWVRLLFNEIQYKPDLQDMLGYVDYIAETTIEQRAYNVGKSDGSVYRYGKGVTIPNIYKPFEKQYWEGYTDGCNDFDGLQP